MADDNPLSDDPELIERQRKAFVVLTKHRRMRGRRRWIPPRCITCLKAFPCQAYLEADQILQDVEIYNNPLFHDIL